MKSSNFKHKSPGKKNNHKKYLILVVVLVLATAAGGSYAYLNHLSNEKDRTTQKARDEAQTSSAKNTLKSVNEDSAAKNDSAVAPNSTTESVPNSTSMQLAIDSVKQSGGQVKSTASITDSGAGGTCNFSFTSTDSKPVVKSVSADNSRGKYSCNVSISEVEFDKIGVWKLTVTYFVNNTKTEVSQNVTIN